MGKIIQFVKKQAVLAVAALLALVSMAFVPPDMQYLAYLDYSVLGILFSLMVVVAGFMEENLFDRISANLAAKSKNTKALSVILVNCVFISSMFVTNDVTLIAFVPVTIAVFRHKGQEKLIFVIVMETIAANIGSMLTPVGNPQNLYLYYYFHIHILDFFKYVFPAGAAGYIIIMCIMLAQKNDRTSMEPLPDQPAPGRKNKAMLLYYAGLFIICVLAVLNIVNYKICFLLVLASIIALNRKLLKKVNFCLLFTFVSFFIFAGNIERMNVIKEEITNYISGRAFLLSVLSSQIISNVPAAMMVSRFTNDAAGVLLGVNIGGLGTPVASLASLISFGLYSGSDGSSAVKYWRVFTIYNIAILTFLVLLFSLFLTRR